MTTEPEQMTFEGHLADVIAKMDSCGFTTELFTPNGGIEMDEEDAFAEPFQPQLLAALHCFLQLFAAFNNRAWVHLAAEMQAGKTGVITTLIRLVLANAKKVNIGYRRIFVLTGMSDNAWKKQTRERMPHLIRPNVKHLRGLRQVATELRRMAASTPLSNVLLFLDESHIASKEGNQPNLFIFETLKSLCPIEEWAERGIRIVTISATDPAKVMAIRAESKLACSVVRLHTAPNYQSVLGLRSDGRVRYIEDVGELHQCEEASSDCKCLGTKHTMPALEEIEYSISEDFNNEPLYHIIRPRVGQQDTVIQLLRERFSDAKIILWDAESRPKKVLATTDDGSSSESLDDINEVLNEEPEDTTFIVLKNMLYAAKTMNDQYIGILYDRLSGKDDTTLQSLLGRSCGYGKSKRSIVYTSKQTISNYESCWKDLSSRTDSQLLVNIPATLIDKKMGGVKASADVRGVSAKLSVEAGMATPYASGLGVDASAGSASGRGKANEDDYESTWQEFNSYDEAKEHAKSVHQKKIINGFYQTSATGKATTLSYATVLSMKAGKKTANMPWKDMEVGSIRQRLYVGYKDLMDSTSGVFVVRTLKRIR